MLIAYLVAAAFAALVGYLSIRDSRMPYWWKWEKVALTFVVAVLCLIYAGTSTGVTAVAEHMRWQVFSSGAGRAWGNGLMYGFATFVLLRLEVATIGFPALGPARLLVDLFMSRFGGRLDVAAERGVARKVGDLQPGGLCRASLQTFWRHVALDLEPDVAIAHLAMLTDQHVEVLTEGEPTDTDELASRIFAAEYLRYGIQRLIIENRDTTIDLSDDVP